ncbi:17511_t:CDS:2, partial [Dentiscutata erythropus]
LLTVSCRFGSLLGCLFELSFSESSFGVTRLRVVAFGVALLESHRGFWCSVVFAFVHFAVALESLILVHCHFALIHFVVTWSHSFEVVTRVVVLGALF